MNRRDFLAAGIAPLIAGPGVARPRQEDLWQAGAARVDITPRRSLWMAGFARRGEPSQGVALPLAAKALALQPQSGRPAVLVTVDLLGMTSRIADAVAGEARRRFGLDRAQLLFNASHTHCGPIVDEQLAVAYDLSPAQWQDIREYSRTLEAQLVEVVGAALARLRPARLVPARGRATFAANRRVAFGPDGPVDHTVPVLRVEEAGGTLAAIVFGYACHNTTLQADFVRFHGDYAGVAQALLEKRHPGTVALFVAGCGADANPKPRGTLDLVEAHGAALARAVDDARPAGGPLAPRLETAWSTVELPFVRGEARQRWRSGLDIEAVYLKRYDALMEALAARRGLPESQPCPVQVWSLGQDHALVALGGETVVDYALRLQGEHAGRQLWVAGYSNDVFGYLPSRRVLREGGYEGADAMVYYGRPGPFTEAVEELVVAEARRLLTVVR